MDDILPVLIALFVLLVFVTVIGHAIWLGLAWLLGSRKEKTASGPQARKRFCPRCGAPLDQPHFCQVCSWPQPVRESGRARAALESLLDRIVQLEQSRVLDAETSRRLRTAAQLELQRVRGEVLQSAAATSAAAASVDMALTGTVSAAASDGAALPILELVDESPVAATPKLAAATSHAQADGISQAPLAPAVPLRPEFRAQQYMARRQQAASEPEAPAAPPPKPRKAISQLLAAFMEEKNIRWGELVGGLLIVCCSIALVISFWAKIAERPFLKFFVFNGVTAALFGVGLYTQHRWKLRTTSQGLLIISTLLVPLNFLAIAAFSQISPGSEVLTIAGEMVSIGLFSLFVFLAGRVILPEGPLLLVVGVLVPSVAQLLVRRFVGVDATLPLLAGLGLVPLVCCTGTNGWLLARARRWPEVGEDQGHSLFKLLGIASFAMLLPLGLMLVKTGHPRETLQQLAVLASLCGVAPLAVGLFLWQRLTDKQHTAMRTAGMSIAVLGAMVLLAGGVLSWPEPCTLLPVVAADCLVFAAVAMLFDLPAAYLLAAPCLVLGYLLSFDLATGRIAWHEEQPRLLAALISGASGSALVPMVLLFAGLAAWSTVRRRSEEALYAGLCAAAISVLSLALVTWFGFAKTGDPFGATWVYGFYAAGSLVAGVLARRSAAVWIGSGLLFAAIAQGLVFALPEALALHQPWLKVLLIHASLMAAAGAVVAWRGRGSRVWLANVFEAAAMIGSAAAVAWLIWRVGGDTAGFKSLHWLWLASVWLVVACTSGSASLFTAFQVALASSVVFGAATQLESRAWFGESNLPWLDPWTLQVEAAALAVFCLAWIGVRLAFKRRITAPAAAANEPADAGADSSTRVPGWTAIAGRLLNPPWPAFDKVVAAGVLATLVWLGAYAAAPGVMQELSPRKTAAQPAAAAGAATTTPVRFVPPIGAFEIRGIPHQHAGQYGTWILMALVAAVFIAGLWERLSTWNLLALFIAASVVCPLLAGRWEADVAAASALRWFSAAFLAAGSAPIWYRHKLEAWTARLAWPRESSPNPAALAGAQSMAFTLALAPVLAMAIYVGAGAVARATLDPALPTTFIGLSVLGGVAAAIGLALRAAAVGVGSGAALKRLDGPWNAWARHASSLVMILGVAPLLVITLYIVGLALRQSPILGPDPGSLFGRMGLATSYAAPILVTACTLVGYALRERSAAFAFAGSLVLNLGVTAAYLLAIAKAGIPFDATQWVRLAQINAVVTSLFAIGWMACLARAERGRTAPEPAAGGNLLLTQIGLAIALFALVLAPAWARLFLDPIPNAVLLAVGDRWGWLAAGVIAAAAGVFVKRTRPALSTEGLLAAFLAATVLSACTVCHFDTRNWLGYHTLLVGHVASAWLLLGCAWLIDKRSALTPALSQEGEGALPRRLPTFSRLPAWTTLAGGLTLLVALRALAGDPAAPWWSIGAILAMSALAVALACRAVERPFVAIAGILINLATTIWWFDQTWAWRALDWTQELAHLVEINVVALALPAIGWMAIELRVFRRDGVARPRVAPFHRLVARLSLAVMSLMVAFELWLDLAHSPLHSFAWLGWLALGATAAASVANLWDVETKDSVAGLYLLGLVACGMGLDQLNLTHNLLAWSGTIILAAYSLLTSYLWSRRRGLLVLADRLRIPRGEEAPFAGLIWLTAANCTLALAVVAIVFWIELTYADFAQRLLASKAALVQVAAVGLLARDTRRTQLQWTALILGVLGAVAFGWAFLQPGGTGNLLHYTVVAAVALGGMAVLYGMALTRLLSEKNEWMLAARRLTPGILVAGAIALVAILALEVHYTLTIDKVPMAWPAILAVAVTLVGLSLAALSAAILPGRDPLGLSERGRQAYVYAAEILLALLFVHIRLTMPWLFHGFFMLYWPVIAMAIAFVGVGVGEIFRRKKQTILADPLENTGALMPLLPVLGFWLTTTRIDYSVLLLSVSVLYAGMSVTRRSFGWSILAALAANGSLWYFLNHQDGFGLLHHPQLWLVPPALCVLAAAYLNRRQLSDAQMTGVRYLTSMVIYVSSTADIFLTGVAQAPWLPLVLMALSVAGIAAGIVLRVRAFLFLGTSFLLLALFTIIRYASVDLQWTWVWAVTGIVVGILIIAVFAVFEKKRDEVLQLVESLKAWEP